MKSEIKNGKVLPIAVFLTAYIIYAVLEIFFNEAESNLLQFVSVGLIGAVILAIIWYSRGEDEVRKSIINQAYGIGFWMTFLVLFALTIFKDLEVFFENILPLWTVPLLAWLAGYVIISIKYR